MSGCFPIGHGSFIMCSNTRFPDTRHSTDSTPRGPRHLRLARKQVWHMAAAQDRRSASLLLGLQHVTGTLPNRLREE